MAYLTSFGPEGLVRHKRAAERAMRKLGHTPGSWRDIHAELSYMQCRDCPEKVGAQAMTGMSAYTYGSALDRSCLKVVG